MGRATLSAPAPHQAQAVMSARAGPRAECQAHLQIRDDAFVPQLESGPINNLQHNHVTWHSVQLRHQRVEDLTAVSMMGAVIVCNLMLWL
jgi:hypothetical protein